MERKVSVQFRSQCIHRAAAPRPEMNAFLRRHDGYTATGSMSAYVSDSTRYWRRLFLVLETVVVVVFLFCLLAERFWGLRVEPQSHVWSIVFGVSIMLAWLSLLIVSPFFLRSLRGVALAGWIIAFGILVFSALTPAL
jgi:hypothetical protein